MSPDAFEALTSVRAFLDSEVLAAVPQALRSELRAAIKTLADVEQEIDSLPSRLRPECSRLLDMVTDGVSLLRERASASEPDSSIEQIEARQQLLAKGLDDDSGSLRKSMAWHREVLHLTGTALVELQALQRRVPPDDDRREYLDELLNCLYRELKQQAQIRLNCQSVFQTSEPPPPTD